MDASDSRPGLWAVDESFFAALFQDVVHAFNLCFGFFADENGAVASSPELLWPVASTPDLSGEVSVDEVHERSELLGVVDRDEPVMVVGEEDSSVDLHIVASLRSSDDSDGQIIDFRVRFQEESPLQSAGGQVEESPTRGDVEQWPRHLLGIEAKRGASMPCVFR